MGGQSPAPLPGPKGKFGAVIAGTLVLYRPDASKKELVVGKVLQNLRDSKAVVLQPYAGVWGSTRVRWSPARVNPETVSYRSLFREVQIGTDGALKYSDLRRVSTCWVHLRWLYLPR